MSDKKEELKPCPFCGSEAIVGIESMGGYWSIGCTDRNCNCWFDKQFETKEIAVEKWNKRTT